MAELATEGRQVIGIGNSTAHIHEVSTIVAFVPDDFPPLLVSERSGRAFRELSNKELAAYGRVPGGFRAQGWLTENLKCNEFFALTLST